MGFFKNPGFFQPCLDRPPVKSGSMVDRERGSSQAIELRPERTEAMRRDLPPPPPPAASRELKREVVLRAAAAAGLGSCLSGSTVTRVAMEANLRTWMLSSKR